MRLKNGIVLDQDFILSPKDIEIQGEWITALTPWRDEELVIPGLIDQHIHGCGGFDVEDASLEALAAMSEELARHGVTSFCPTVMARPIEGLPPILDMIRAGQRQGLPGAYVHGARLEGPYLSPLKKGAQKESCLSKPDAGEFLALWNRYPGLIKIVDLAGGRRRFYPAGSLQVRDLYGTYSGFLRGSVRSISSRGGPGHPSVQRHGCSRPSGARSGRRGAGQRAGSGGADL